MPAMPQWDENIFKKFQFSQKDLSLIQSNSFQRIYRATGKERKYLLKISAGNDPLSMSRIKKEANGLIILNKNGLRTPKIYAIHPKFLLMEYIDSDSRPVPDKEYEAGQALARMHQKHYKYAGYMYDNFIGSLVQYNGPSIGANSSGKKSRTEFLNWPRFFTEYRVRPYLNMLDAAKPGGRDYQFWSGFLQKLPAFIPDNPVSLVHGDLWGGNMLAGNDEYVFIDPAVNYADRYMDLAMSELFGGFSSSFYKGYNDVYPVEKEFSSIKKLYQLYYILIHAVLFGSSYYHSAKEIAGKFK